MHVWIFQTTWIATCLHGKHLFPSTPLTRNTCRNRYFGSLPMSFYYFGQFIFPTVPQGRYVHTSPLLPFLRWRYGGSAKARNVPWATLTGYGRAWNASSNLSLKLFVFFHFPNLPPQYTPCFITISLDTYAKYMLLLFSRAVWFCPYGIWQTP